MSMRPGDLFVNTSEYSPRVWYLYAGGPNRNGFNSFITQSKKGSIITHQLYMYVDLNFIAGPPHFNVDDLSDTEIMVMEKSGEYPDLQKMVKLYREGNHA